MAATLIGFTGLGLRAQMPEALPLPAVWDAVHTVRGGGGYKDNVFLSHANPQGSAFVSGGADVMVLRLAPIGPQINLFASADVDHFLSLSPSHDEYTVFAQAQVEQSLSAAMKASLAAEYFYQDQFLDLTFLDPAGGGTNASSHSAAVRGHTLTARPGLRLDLPGRFWLALEGVVTRQYFEQPLDDSWKAGGKFTAGHTYGHNSHVSISYEPAWRWFDTEAALTETGTPIPATRRERFQQEAILAWRHYWDEPKHWRTTTKLGGRTTSENGGGFADYTEFLGSAQILYRAKPWEVAAEGKVRNYDYRTQTVSATDPAKRRRTEWVIGFRLERDLSRHLRLVTSFEREETLSNDELETYTMNTVSGLLQWEF